MKYLYDHYDVHGPHLIIAPLSTIPHWQREFALADLNVIVFDGHEAARDVVRQYEWNTFEVDGQPRDVRGHYKFDVCLTSYSAVLNESRMLAKVPWKVVVCDEAQRTKGHSSKLTTILQDHIKYEHAILLTGTPIQNDMSELYSLLHTIAPKEFPKLATFLAEYGDLRTSEQIRELHSRLRPYLLRRMKSDVEKGLPPREEIIIEVSLSRLQQQFYRAIYEQNAGFLRQLTGRKGNGKKTKEANRVSMPSLLNVAMQLRHVANHPYLLKANQQVELNRIATLKAERRAKGESTEGPEFHAAVMKQLIDSSGKFILLSKLLPRLQSEGHRVLIFSQFKLCLNILEDFIHYLGYKYERIDGNITGDERQQAIDRFSKPGSDGFIFLLSTKAGGTSEHATAGRIALLCDA
jgi:SNF2 family DNA or RNA helicase